MEDHHAEDDRRDITKEDVERTAHALRDAYAQMRGFYSRHGYYHSRDLDEKFWNRIAPVILGRGINPHHFVKTTFEYHLYQLRKPVAWVQEVASTKAVDRYLENKDRLDNELRLLLRLQLDTIREHLRRGRTAEEIIEDRTLELSVVVRYALALRAQLTELARGLQVEAELDLRYEPQYQQFVKELTEGAE